MTYISIDGGDKLEGEIVLQGSKNAALPILAAGILCRGKVLLHHCPEISDVRELLYAVSFAGVKSTLQNGNLEFDATEAHPYFFGPELAGKTRGGVLLLGAFLGRFHEAGMAYPGGCAIGARPIDLHCKVLRAMGAILSEEEDGIYVSGKLRGGQIVLSYPSVGATENAILAAVCANGQTTIAGAAREPEIAELCRFLNKAGAKIRGIGTARIVINGVPELHEVEYTVTGDRIAAGTYMAGALMTGGEIVLHNTAGVCMKGIFECLCATGAKIYRTRDVIAVRGPKHLCAVPKLVTAPYPAFPTDMQSQTAALLSLAEGTGSICETVFESRFGIVPELQKMGADISHIDRYILIRGVKKLHGAYVTASDLRSGAALVLAGIAAEGKSRVYGTEYIERGYEDICGALRLLGARIQQTEEN